MLTTPPICRTVSVRLLRNPRYTGGERLPRGVRLRVFVFKPSSCHEQCVIRDDSTVVCTLEKRLLRYSLAKAEPEAVRVDSYSIDVCLIWLSGTLCEAGHRVAARGADYVARRRCDTAGWGLSTSLWDWEHGRGSRAAISVEASELPRQSSETAWTRAANDPRLVS